uniref:Uncharacterized protein n=1 Tax=Plectus sambesii TaxID=2011161 RepID=A0A914VJL9_9BILA
MGNGLMSLLQDWSTQVVLIFLGSVLIVLVFTLCCCMFCCTLRQRHATKVTNAAKGKFLDTSHRIFKEQRVHKGKLSLYHEVMIAGMKEEDEERPTDERSPLRSQAGTTDAGGHHQSASVASLKSFPFPQTHSP